MPWTSAGGRSCWWMILAVVLIGGCGGEEPLTLELRWVADDDTYVFSRTQARLELARQAPRSPAKEPIYGSTPRYGVLPLGNVAGEEIALALDVAPGGGKADPSLYLDANHNGDLTDDPVIQLAGYPDYPDYFHAEGIPVTWIRADGTGRQEAAGELDFLLRWDREEDELELRPSYQGRMRGEILLGGSEAADLLLYDADLNGLYDELDLMVIDTDRNGELDGARNSVELFRVTEPFVLADRALIVREVSADGRRLVMGRARGRVEPRIPLVAGMPAPEFTLPDLEGDEVSFSSYRGHPLILVFWATW